MILTITPNPALDVTYHLDRLRLGSSLRVSAVQKRAGGKGVNVARVLHGLGEQTLSTGLVGGSTGQAVRAGLDEVGLPHDFVDIAGETRRTVTVVDSDGEATVLLEPGPVITAAEWTSFLEHLRRLVPRASVLVVSGSLPQGVSADSAAALVAIGREAGIPVVLDTSGPALIAALAAKPTLVKPNLDELCAITPHLAFQDDDEDEVRTRAEAVRALGASAVVCSLGQDGMIAVIDQHAWHARLSPGVQVSGNPTGAGDAAVAALAVAVRDRRPWPEGLRNAVALSAAAVASPVAGAADPQIFHDLLPAVHIRPIGVAAGHELDAS
jgi:tagatose 6-phosphate kinase